MKKGILSLLLVLAVLTYVMAQPTLTSTTNTAVPGDIFVITPCDSIVSLPGNTGSGVIWNFSSLSIHGVLDTVIYCNPSSTPYIDSFPTSNLADHNPLNTNYDYYIANTTKWAYVGINNSGSCNYYQPSKSFAIYNYPITYGNTFIDTNFLYMLGASAFTSYSIEKIVADAYGTLILPTGTFTNVLRMHRIYYTTDSTYTNVLDSNDAYFWAKAGNHMPLLALDYYSFNGIRQFGGIEYVTQIAANIFKFSDINITLQLNPNPAKENFQINFQLSNINNASLIITDLVGKEIIKINKDLFKIGSNQIEIDAQEYPAGLYFVKLQTNNNCITQKIFITK